jgi:hypothetical protein
MKRLLPVMTGLVFVGAGIAAMTYRKKGAAVFGLPTEDTTALAFAGAAGARDLAIGFMLLLAPQYGRRLLLSSSVISVCDFMNVLMTADDPPLASLGIHASGTAGLFVLALMTPGHKKFAQ